jgi:hypothetical protein
MAIHSETNIPARRADKAAEQVLRAHSPARRAARLA